MERIQTFCRTQLIPILLFFVAFGFVMVLAEMLLTDHVKGIQLVAVFTPILGFIAVLIGYFARGGLRVAMAVVLVLLSISGVVGFFEHQDAAGEGGEGGEGRAVPGLMVAYQPVSYTTELASATSNGMNQDEPGESAAPSQAAPQGETARPERRGETVPPPLAPLSLSGFALLGAVVLFAKKDPSPAKP